MRSSELSVYYSDYSGAPDTSGLIPSLAESLPSSAMSKRALREQSGSPCRAEAGEMNGGTAVLSQR